MQDQPRSRQLTSALGAVREIARDRATTVVRVPGGDAVLNEDFPAAHDLNKLLIATPCTPDALSSAAADVLGGAGLEHRLIEVHDAALGRELAVGLAAHGYASAEQLVMAVNGPAQRQPPMHRVVELDVHERAERASAEWRRDQPDWDEDVCDQLGRRITTVLAAAQATFFAVRGSDGAVWGRADLYLRDGVAQVEEVMTDPAYRRRGVAGRLVLRAVERARSAGAELVFLIAEADDWPQRLYRELGFSDLGHLVSLTATAGGTGAATPP